MILRNGLLLSLLAVFLQVSVFLQPLLPEKFQISPVCETITLALLKQTFSSDQHTLHSHDAHANHDHQIESLQTSTHDHHDPSHQCQYCTVYANLVLPPEANIKEILVKVNVQLIWLQQQFEHVYFALQRLFLLPQGRAPPALTS